jgi:hypothetical protein
MGSVKNMRQRFIQGFAAAMACTLVSGAWASVTTQITVADFRVQLGALVPGAAPAASFASVVGSTAECESSSGDPLTNGHRFVSSGQPFGVAMTTVSTDPFAASTAELDGNAFGAGATVQTSAYASSLATQTTAQGTIGLVNNVSTASFTLAPWTVMTISASVRASASSTGANPLELADSGILMSIGDSEGTGPQWSYVNFNAFAFGGMGAYNDTEMSFVSLSYKNDTAAPVSGLFSGYVSSFASSGIPVVAVPEPADAAMLAAGLLAVGYLYRRLGDLKRDVRRPELSIGTCHRLFAELRHRPKVESRPVAIVRDRQLSDRRGYFRWGAPSIEIGQLPLRS